MTRRSSESGLPAMRMDCGINAGAPRTSTFLLIQAAHSRASQRSWRRFRKVRSVSEPVKPTSPPVVAGRTTRQVSSFSSRSRSSANANREKAGDAKSREDGGTSEWRSSSMTRSLPVFLMIFTYRVQRILRYRDSGSRPPFKILRRPAMCFSAASPTTQARDAFSAPRDPQALNFTVATSLLSSLHHFTSPPQIDNPLPRACVRFAFGARRPAGEPFGPLFTPRWPARWRASHNPSQNISVTLTPALSTTAHPASPTRSFPRPVSRSFSCYLFG